MSEHTKHRLIDLIGEQTNAPYSSREDQIKGLEEFRLTILAAEAATRRVLRNVEDRRRKRPTIETIYDQCLRELRERGG